MKIKINTLLGEALNTFFKNWKLYIFSYLCYFLFNEAIWLIPFRFSNIYIANIMWIKYYPFTLDIRMIYLLIFSGFLNFCCCSFFLRLTRNQQITKESLLDDFKLFNKTFCLNFIIGLTILFRMFLLILPGVIAILNYSMAFFILSDEPNLSIKEVLSKSKKMIKGHRLEYLRLMINFIWGHIFILFFYLLNSIFLIFINKRNSVTFKYELLYMDLQNLFHINPIITTIITINPIYSIVISVLFVIIYPLMYISSAKFYETIKIEYDASLN